MSAPPELIASIFFLDPGSLPPEVKSVIAAGVLLAALLGGVVWCSVSERARDVAFFFLVGAMVLSDRMDVNFLSREWYRGSTRGIEISFLDVVALSLLISSILVPRFRPRFFWPRSLGLILLLFGYQCFSVASSQPQIFGLFEITKTVRALVVFLAAATFVRGVRELRLLVLALACTVSLEALLSVKHRLAHVDRSTGTFVHANSLSIYLCMVTPVLVAALTAEWDKWVRRAAGVAVAAACVAIVLTVSRAGIPAFAAVVLATAALCGSWRLDMRKVTVVLIGFVAVAGVVVANWNNLKERFGSATLEEELSQEGFENRGQYVGLLKAIMQDRPQGVGLNNWSYWVSKRYGPRTGTAYEDYDDIPPSILASPQYFDLAPNYAPPAHSLAVITLGELGIPGAVIFALLWLRWFGMGVRFLWPRLADPMYRLPVGIFFGALGLFLQSLTEWVYRETDILLTFHILVGALAGLYWVRRRERRLARAEARQEEPLWTEPRPAWET